MSSKSNLNSSSWRQFCRTRSNQSMVDKCLQCSNLSALWCYKLHI